MLEYRCNANKLEAKKMAMSTSEIDQVTHLIDRSKNELQSQIDEAKTTVTSNIFKVMFIVTALVQIEIVATAWWLVSH
jgi:hypothetical protein